ncbi:MAG: DNA integrity scanning protein DisA nucleotide-binding domain protein [Planctomycetota bacterium]|nr:DNA integrity scanning protein DisA nucleotide-binding domain protein [Planctomycetota bacterium]
MKAHRFSAQLASMVSMGAEMSETFEADAILVMLDAPVDWEKLQEEAGDETIVVAADHEEKLAGADEAGLAAILLDREEAPVFEKLTQALLECVADDILAPSSAVVAIYSSFESGKMDAIRYIKLAEHLGRLTARDLRELETRVPLETLKLVLDLAVDIGREGREGKAVGTMFVVGDTRNVLAYSHPAGFDPVRGYNAGERDLHDPRVREAIKEIAQLDGGFIVKSDGTVDKACRLLDAPHSNLTLSKGLGARHWAGAAISKQTNAIAIVVSESNGTVRLFHDGEVILRVEPLRRPLKWKDFEYEPPSSTGDKS